MKFWKSSVWSFLSVGTRALTGLLINKFFAVQFGATGVSLLAHFQNLLNIFYLLANEGIHKGLIKVWSETDGDESRKMRHFWAGIILNCGLLLLGGVVLGVGESVISSDFLLEDGYVLWSAILLLFIATQIGNFFGLSLLLAWEQIRWYALLNLLGGLGAIATLYAFQMPTIWQTLLVYHVGSSLGFGATVWIVGRKLWKRKWLISAPKIQQQDFLIPLSFLGMAASSNLLQRLGDFWIRTKAFEVFSEEVVGRWQALVKLSDSYVVMFSSTFIVIFFPRLSKVFSHKLKRKLFLREVTLLVLPLMLSLLTGVYLFREWLLTLLFSKEFLPAAIWMPYVVIGDFFRLSQYFLGQILLVAGKIKQFILIQVIFSAIYMAYATVLVNTQQLDALIELRMWTYIFATLVVFGVVRRWF
ncbi:MAG: hypothetical protein AAF740_00705 [Bacteroidota bacterium]